MIKLSTVIPYDALNSYVWTVSNLWDRSKKTLEGINLPDLVEFNTHKFDFEHDTERSLPYLEIGDIHGELGIVTVSVKEGQETKARARNLAHSGDILVALVRPQSQNVAIVPASIPCCIVSSSFAVLTPKKISSQLLFFILRSDLITKLFSSMAVGTVIPQMSIKGLKDVVIPLKAFPIDAEIEDQAHKLYLEWIKRAQSAKTFGDIASQIIKEELILRIDAENSGQKWLIQPYDALRERWDAQYYFKINDEPKIFWNCPVLCLHELVDFPRFPVLANEDQFTTGVPFVRVKDIDADSLWLHEHGFAATVPDAEAVLKEKDIVMVKTGSLSGNTALVPAIFEGGQLNQHSIVLRIKEPSLLAEYLVVFLKSDWFKKQMQKMLSGSFQNFIQITELLELRVPLPPGEKQKEIVDACLQEYSLNDIEPLKADVERFLESVLATDGEEMHQ